MITCPVPMAFLTFSFSYLRFFLRSSMKFKSCSSFITEIILFILAFSAFLRSILRFFFNSASFISLSNLAIFSLFFWLRDLYSSGCCFSYLTNSSIPSWKMLRRGSATSYAKVYSFNIINLIFFYNHQTNSPTFIVSFITFMLILPLRTMVENHGKKV